jgi:hypothetical protein
MKENMSVGFNLNGQMCLQRSFWEGFRGLNKLKLIEYVDKNDARSCAYLQHAISIMCFYMI